MKFSRKLLKIIILVISCLFLYTCEWFELERTNIHDPDNTSGVYEVVYDDPDSVTIVTNGDTVISWQNELLCSTIIDRSNIKTAYYNIQFSESEDESAFDSSVYELVTDNNEGNVIDIVNQSLLSDKEYFWRVRVVLSTDAISLETESVSWGEWSGISSFTTVSLVNVISTTTIDTTPSIEWSLIVNESDTSNTENINGYEIRYSLTEEGINDAIEYTVASTTYVVSIDNVLNYGDIIYYQVRPVIDNEIKGFWSAVGSVDIIEPDLSPVSIVDEGITIDTTPFISWTEVSGALEYDIRYGLDIGALDSQTSYSISTAEYTVPIENVFSFDDTVYWQLRAKNEDGVYTSWSSFSFNVKMVPPWIPVTPDSGTTTNDTTPFISWTEVSGASEYDIRYGLDSGALDSQTSYSISTAEYTVPIENVFSFDDTVYWQLRAKNDDGVYTSWSSPPFSFNVDWNPNWIPESIPDSGTTIDTTPFISWTEVPGATGYDIRYRLDSNTLDYETPYSISTAEYTVPIANVFSFNKPVYWQLRAKNDDGVYTSWSSSFSFNVDWIFTTNPIFPLDGATDIEDTTALINWDDVSGASSYNIRVGIDSSTLSSQPLINATSSEYQVTVSLNVDNLDTVYWQVQPINADGLNNGWGSVYSYTINIDTGLIISPDLDNPITVTLSGQMAQVTLDDIMTITADTSLPVSTYSWYLEGSLLSGETETSIIIDASTFSAGVYELTCEVSESGASGSTNIQFEVIYVDSVLDYTIVSPLDNSYINSISPTFEWNDINGAGLYWIQISDQSDFSNIIEQSKSVTFSNYSMSSSLTENISYYWRVTSNLGNGWENWSSVNTFVADITVPGVVTDFEFVANGGFVAFSWINPIDLDFTGVKILKKLGSEISGIDDMDALEIYNGTDTTFTDSYVANGNIYYYSIFTFDNVSNSIGTNLLCDFSYNFTNAAMTGRYGPSQDQIDTAYISTTLESLVTSIDGIQEWNVPYTGIYRIEVYGASGGTQPQGYSQGLGAKMTGGFQLSEGDTLKILVGQKGNNNGYSDGGAGGGGGSFVVSSNNTPLIIAGGGGGMGGDSSGIDATTTTTAANGYGYSNAGTDGNGGANSYTYSGSGGGFYTNGSSSYSGYSFLNGGLGGDYTVDGGFGGGGAARGSSYDYAGGGGGYSGGGDSYEAGGGGGSYNSGENQDNESGLNSGHGYVVIYGPY